MRGFSISKAMLVIALIAENFAAVRALNPEPIAPGVLPLLLTGLLPLVDAQIIGLYLIVRRYRFALRRRTGTGFGAGVLAFSVFNATSLILLIAACVNAPERFARNLDFFLDPIGQWFRSVGYTQQDFEAPRFRLLVGPLFIGAAMSGPPVILGLLLGWLANRYELVIDRRPETRRTPADAPVGEQGP
jgi:hypothetical protein